MEGIILNYEKATNQGRNWKAEKGQYKKDEIYWW